MKALRTPSGNIVGWNRNIWKTGRCQLVDMNEKPTPPELLEEIREVTGMEVSDGQPATHVPEQAASTEPAFQTGVGDTAAEAEAATEEAPAPAEETPASEDDNVAGDDIDLDELDVDDL